MELRSTPKYHWGLWQLPEIYQLALTLAFEHDIEKESVQKFITLVRTFSINGQWGLMGINNVPLILMEINGD